MSQLPDWDGLNFNGSKIALFCGDDLLVYLRDDKPDIPFPGHWDLPGGGRENNETPLECALRETEEEFGIRIPATQVHEMQTHNSATRNSLSTYFFIGTITEDQIAAIRFGDEGQFWKLMKTDTFLVHPKAVPHLQDRLKKFRTATLSGSRG